MINVEHMRVPLMLSTWEHYAFEHIGVLREAEHMVVPGAAEHIGVRRNVEHLDVLIAPKAHRRADYSQSADCSQST